MRIVFVSNEYPPQFGGGIGTYVAAMSRIMAGRGHRVTVITVTAQRYPQREQVDGVEIVRLPLIGSTGPEPMATLQCWQARADAVARLLSRLHRADPIDLVEFADYRGEGVACLAGTSPADRPICVVKLHTPIRILNKFNPSGARYPVLAAFEEQALRLADRVVSPSTALVREMRAELPDLPAVDVLPNPVDPRFLADCGPVLPESSQVLYVGRLEERKGVETLIAAAPAFLDGCPDATLHLVGGDTVLGPRAESMRDHLHSLLPARYHARVQFHEPMPAEQLIERYRAARLCVFPSHFENFPNTCLEAMALGRPVIGTDRSGMAEMIEPGASGSIVPAADAHALTEAMITLYRLPATDRARMGQAARERIARLYHPEVIGQQMETLYGRYQQSAGRSPCPVKAVNTPADTPEVAVVIPCYNHGAYLRETLASVRAQDWPSVSCVVVDDGSTDPQTVRVLAEVEAEGTRVIRQPNQGLSAARNTGVRATDSPFFVPLDADDKIAPNFIRTLIAPLLESPELGYCYSQAAFFGAASGVWACPEYEPRKLLVENLSVATAVIRRAAYDSAGGYQTDMVHGFEDWDFWLALLSVGYHGRRVAEPLFFYRKHPRGVSMLDKTQRHRAEMIRLMVEHHRELFASMLDVSMSDKDAMFFRAHMEAWQLRESGGGAGTLGPPTTLDDALCQSLAAQAQLDYIENSRTWQSIQRLKRIWPYRLWATLIHGRDWDQPSTPLDPRERLAAIKRSRFYRLLALIRSSRPYQAYARRKYGPDFVNQWTR